MSTTHKNIKKKASSILKEYFETNNMVFYQRTLDDDVEIFLLPYTINKQTIRFSIKIIVFNDINSCRMSLSCELNENNDSNKTLLDMNAKLTKGRLSVETDSNEVTYSTTFTLDTKADIEKQYKQNFEICLSVLADLYQKNIIKTNE